MNNQARKRTKSFSWLGNERQGSTMALPFSSLLLSLITALVVGGCSRRTV
jgi:hypothetical protein